MAVGYHIIVDLYGVENSYTEHIQPLKEIFEEAIKLSKMHTLESFFYQFKPSGASGIILIEESHFSFHTYPEYKLITFDLYSCGNALLLYGAYLFLAGKIPNTNISMKLVKRGEEIG